MIYMPFRFLSPKRSLTHHSSICDVLQHDKIINLFDHVFCLVNYLVKSCLNWSNLEIISWILERSLFVAITPTYLHTYTYIVYVITHFGNKEISITCSWTIVTSRYPISSRKHRRSWHGLTTPPFFLYNFLLISTVYM
jgi:hypothetical protein